ncbi:MAG TPA: proton-conducting transporter membrane subunit [Thermoanaerobaculia bacterium]|nr:proton-conducting transporter membrane subunit [Thermoanaerobaculia bacterium]
MGLALSLLITAASLLAASGLPGLLLRRRSSWGPRIATAATVAAAAAGVTGCVLALGGAEAGSVSLPSVVPGARLLLSLDALSAFFALPVFVVGALGSLYGLAYWPPAENPRNGRRLRSCYGLLLGGITVILLARDAAGFLVAWELMALSGYFLVTTDPRSRETRRAGWLYLIYSHAGTLCLGGFFALLAGATGDFTLRPLAPGEVGGGVATALFGLAFLGFGVKAGAMPLHSWLPAAHAAAPSHVSALMSGVMLKVGVYGIVRVTGLLPSPPLSWGAAVLAVGAVSAVIGIAFALAQRDLKRLLAYSSIENVGIILLGLGLALVGRSLERPEWVLLGLAGCLLHVWNHALFKSLLFFGAGSVAHATGSRDLEKAGGLARRMPATATLFLVGSLAICGLPPGNGFVSELFVYLGLVRTTVAPSAAWAALPAPVLAATGALALACFVKVVGVAFLGTPRSAAAESAHESPALMLAPMALLAAGCLLLGVAPGLVAPVLERVVAVWAGGSLAGASLAELVPLGPLAATAVALLAGVALLAAAVIPACRRGRSRQPALPTWDCGYAAASPRLQYTASSFAQLVTSRFAWALRPAVHAARLEGPFPGPSRFHSQVDDSVLETVLLPRLRRLRQAANRVRATQQGDLQRYVLYVVAAVAVLLLFNLRFDGLVSWLCRP